jgi:hypothetical protein
MTGHRELPPRPPLLPLDQLRHTTRSARARPVRGRTIRVADISQKERDRERRANPDADRRHLPLTRGECIDGVRPCPFVSCRYLPDLDVTELEVSCVLDLVASGPLDNERIGRLMNITRERVRQIEEQAVGQLSRGAVGVKLREWADEGPVGKRRLPVLQGQNEEST